MNSGVFDKVKYYFLILETSHTVQQLSVDFISQFIGMQPTLLFLYYVCKEL